MDEDVTNKANTFITGLFGADALGDEKRASLTSWIGALIQQERQGWMKKIQMSLKEVEKERKLALDVHSRIHALNNKFEPFLIDIRLFREASMYYATDTDAKVSHIDQLEKNLRALFETLAFLQEERLQCMSALNVDDESTNIAHVISRRVSRLEGQNKQLTENLKDTENRLEREIKNLQETLDLRIRVSKVETEKYEKKMKDNKKTVTELRAKIRELSMAQKNSAKRDVGSSNSVRTASTFSTQGATSSLGQHTMDSSTQTTPAIRSTRDCCIQVTIHGKDVNSHNKDGTALTSKSRDKLLNSSQSQEKLNFAQDVDIGDLRALPPPTNANYPITAITIVKKKSDGKSIHDVIDANNAVIKKFASASLTSFSETTGQENASKYDTSLKGSARTVEFLRGQVTHLVNTLEQTRSKLDASKQETERLRQQMSSLRTRAIHKELFLRSHDDVTNFTRSGGNVPSEGKLMGIKVRESPRLSQSHAQQNGGGPASKTSKPSFFNGMAKCLRCNKVYKLSENNDHACRYHAKSRKQIERYDNQGRLVKVTHFWQCCQRAGDSTGCQLGEHV